MHVFVFVCFMLIFMFYIQRKLVEDGTERGASFSVYHQGERLVDIWGGYADPESLRPWREDTITMVWSATKGVTALAIAKLVER